MKRKHVIVLLILVWSTAAAAAEVVSREPAGPARRLVLEEQWRLGGEDSDLLFGLLIEAARDADGTAYLLDQQLCTVTVVAPDGTVAATLGGRGDGPGEVRTPQDVTLLADGSVALAEQFPGKIVRLAPDGTPRGSLQLGRGAEGGYTVAASLEHRGPTTLLGGLFQTPSEHGQDRTSFLAGVDAEGTETVRFCENTVELDFQKAHFSERTMIAPFLAAHAVGPDGAVYAARDWAEYRIDVFEPDGTLRRTVGRDFRPRRRSDRERKRVDALFEVQAEQLPFPLTWDTEPDARTIAGLHVDDAGRLWVEHARSGHEQPDGVLLTYDVFDPDGTWRCEASLVCDGDPRYDGFIFLDDERVLLVKGLVMSRLTASGSQGAVYDEEDAEEASEIEVICYRLPTL